MARAKPVPIPKDQLKKAIRYLERLEVLECMNCVGESSHDSSCPARPVRQLINSLNATFNQAK
jgi:hypothetical protein